MAQGAAKKSASNPTHNKSKRTVPAAGLKKGARTIAPKRTSLIKQQRITKKVTSGLTAQTERKLAERAGHLELLAGGRKKGDGAEKKGKDVGKK